MPRTLVACGRLWSTRRLCTLYESSSKDYVWIEPHHQYPFIVGELIRTWVAVVEKHENPKVAEQMVGMGYNLVPWQLGPLQILRNLNEGSELGAGNGRKPIFATAYDLLSRRFVTLERDFFHALIGMSIVSGLGSCRSL